MLLNQYNSMEQKNMEQNMEQTFDTNFVYMIIYIYKFDWSAAAVALLIEDNNAENMVKRLKLTFGMVLEHSSQLALGKSKNLKKKCKTHPRLLPTPALPHLREGAGAPLSPSQRSHGFLGK